MTQQTTPDSISIIGAAETLQNALKKLETALMPMQARLKMLEANSENAALLDEDRARLAQELDDSKAKEISAKEREDAYKAKEAEFAQLAEETMREMDSVISQVKSALARD